MSNEYYNDLTEKIDTWYAEMEINNKRSREETERINSQILQPPANLSKSEQKEYLQILETFKSSIQYRLSPTDGELIYQYCQLKIMRDKALKTYLQNPERYIRIVTGLSSDGKTPKVTIKENEHYKTFQDCNKQLEKILKDLRLTPEARAKKRF